jgi:hypothetical protein
MQFSVFPILIWLCKLLGWQPGNPEEAAVWDEDWDKFEDEGMPCAVIHFSVCHNLLEMTCFINYYFSSRICQ